MRRVTRLIGNVYGCNLHEIRLGSQKLLDWHSVLSGSHKNSIQALGFHQPTVGLLCGCGNYTSAFTQQHPLGFLARQKLKQFSMDSSSGDENDDVVVETAEVLIDLDDNFKGKLACDFSAICEVSDEAAREILGRHKWNMQEAIDSFLDAENGTENPQEEMEGDDTPAQGAKNETESASSSSKMNVAKLPVIASPGGTSSWAPEKFSVISWNLDGLDDKNLERRTAAVVDLIEKDNYSIVFFQELLPTTFHYIATRLETKYLPVIGTENPGCEYLTATFLRLNHIVYTDHEIVSYPGTAMGRNVLVTKCYTGKAKLALLNTHLESTAAFADERRAQLKKCFDICKSFPADWNVIFGGDLNLRDKEVCGIMPANMSDLWIKCGERTSCKYTWDLTRNTNKQMPSKYQPRMRFDRFYYRESVPKSLTPEFFGVTGIEKVTGTQSFPSDHWAIISFFRLELEARKPNPKKRKGDPITSP